MAKKCLVIGADTLSRVIDIYDRDSMIYADGAGAAILEATNEAGGILSYSSATYTSNDETGFLYYGNSNNQSHDQNEKFIKMFGRKVYEFALNHVPEAMENCFEKFRRAERAGKFFCDFGVPKPPGNRKSNRKMKGK